MVALEVCIDSFESAQKIAHIVNQGKNRIELCGNLIYGGGLTPSLGLLTAIKTVIPADRIMVMIRPRLGSFIYTEAEVETMTHDIRAFKAQGVRGVVFGCLTPEGHIDVPTTSKLAAVASPFEVTFHRAFDISIWGWEKEFDDLRKIKGITRLLTRQAHPRNKVADWLLSGHGKTAVDGAAEIASLILRSTATDGPIICPASGVNATNVPLLQKAIIGLQEVHMTGSSAVPGSQDTATVRGQELGFGGQEWRLDPMKIERVWDMVKEW